MKILSGKGELILEYDGIIDEGQNLVYVNSAEKTSWIINEPAGSCVQKMLDNWCKGLGTYDGVENGSDDPFCNENQFARKNPENGKWTCWDELEEEIGPFCTNDFGEIIQCQK